ncbi:MAG: ABC transporter ATP-binding protein [Eubacterium sp.]|nr:ABC transporter ATP-binding protein [Eubacterium sp.]
MKDPILKLSHISKTFYSAKTGVIPAVQDVCLDIKEEECVGIVGESGCGKSTIARMVTRITDTTEGQIFLEGEDITSLQDRNLKKIYKKIQMVFQDPYSVFSPRMQIGTFLEEGLVHYGIANRSEARQEAKILLSMVELGPELLDRFPHELSGGQLQRVVIARAISIEPRLVILDEATSALDVSVQKQVLRLLVKLQKRLGLTYLFIGHDLAVVRSISDRIVVMYAGNVVEEIASESLEETAAHPYTRKLLDSVFSVYDRDRKKIELETLSMQDAGYEEMGCPYQKRCPFVHDRCRSDKPELIDHGGGHKVRCFYYQ